MTNERKMLIDAYKGCFSLLVILLVTVSLAALVIGGGVGLIWRVFHWAAG